MLLIDSFNFKEKVTCQAGDSCTENVEIVTVPLKYLSNFWRTLEMLLINCKNNLIFTRSATCVIVSTTVPNQVTKFAIIETNI